MIRPMRPISAALAVAIFGSLLLCSGCDGYTRLHGTIRDANGFPVAGALVVFNPRGSAYPKQTQSSPEGTYDVGSTHAPSRHVPLTLVVSRYWVVLPIPVRTRRALGSRIISICRTCSPDLNSFCTVLYPSLEVTVENGTITLVDNLRPGERV
jgi:hypothetical protein